jgi:hypothetical protein
MNDIPHYLPWLIGAFLIACIAAFGAIDSAAINACIDAGHSPEVCHATFS